MDSHLGLDQLRSTPSDAFWRGIQERLDMRGKDVQDWGWPAKLLVVVTGEAANDPELLSIVKDMAATLPKVISPPESQEKAPEVGAELLILEDPVSAPATGAALWSRMKVESASYCEVDDCSPPFLHLMPITWESSDEKNEL